MISGSQGRWPSASFGIYTTIPPKKKSGIRMLIMRAYLIGHFADFDVSDSRRRAILGGAQTPISCMLLGRRRRASSAIGLIHLYSVSRNRPARRAGAG